MKKIPIIVSTGIALALGIGCFMQWLKLYDEKNQNIALQAELDQRTHVNANLQALQQLAQEQRREAVEQSERLATKLQVLQKAVAKTAGVAKREPSTDEAADNAAKPGKEKKGFGMLAKMMDDPDMKKMIREQQRAALDQIYGPLVKQLNLTPEEAGRFKDMLADNSMKNAMNATAMFDGSSSTNQAGKLAALAEGHKEFAQQLKDLLGENRYQVYEEYLQTVGERTQLSQFRLQTAGTDAAFSDQQVESLLGLMREEKRKVAAATGQPLTETESDPAKMQAMFAGDGVEKYLQAQETANQQVFARAREMLTPAQLESFGKFQENQIKMTRLGINMARKFMNPDKSSPSAALAQ